MEWFEVFEKNAETMGPFETGECALQENGDDLGLRLRLLGELPQQDHSLSIVQNGFTF
jgi:hypothetical protein